MRRTGPDATYLQMQETVARSAVTDTSRIPTHNQDGEEILISRGTVRGGGLVFAGLPVHIIHEGPTALISTNSTRVAEPEGPQYIRTRDHVGYAHTGVSPDGMLIMDRLAHPVGSSRILIRADRLREVFVTVESIVPPLDSYWRDPNIPGSFVTVNGHGQDPGATHHVTVTTESGMTSHIPLDAFLRRHTRFDEGILPKVGSVWVSRGNNMPIVVTEVGEAAGLHYVVTRNTEGRLLRMVVPDLWRNYLEDATFSGKVSCAVGEELINSDGQSFHVAVIDNQLGIVTLTNDITGDRIMTSAAAIDANWHKVDRRDAYDKLTQEDDPLGLDS
jgi:hypothetical protein